LRNAQLLSDAYTGAGGDSCTVVNAVDQCPVAEFADPLHLAEGGRLRLAQLIAEAIRPHLR
jgi:hypothetical protein